MGWLVVTVFHRQGSAEDGDCGLRKALWVPTSPCAAWPPAGSRTLGVLFLLGDVGPHSLLRPDFRV